VRPRNSAHFVDTEKHVGGVVTTALQIGYRGFDTADLYYTEPLLAEAFGKAFKSGVVRREDLFCDDKAGSLRGRPHRFPEEKPQVPTKSLFPTCLRCAQPVLV
jgi:diketogulonate reductase-like aldo/keto reductase